MPLIIPRCRLSVVSAIAGVLVVFGGIPTAAAQSTSLAAPQPAALTDRSYGVAFLQTMALQGESQGMSIVRDARLRVTFGAGRRRGALNEVALVVDSARGSTTNPHAREVLDLRSLRGSQVVVTYGDSGATWPTPVPDLSFGDYGKLPLSSVLDPLFPALPARAMAAGATWERSYTRRSLHGADAVTHPITVRYTLQRYDVVRGTRLARITFDVVADPSSPTGFKSSGAMLVGAGDGLLHELTVEETASGIWLFQGNEFPFIQTNALRYFLHGGAAAAASQP